MSIDRSAITETECREIAAALGEGWTPEHKAGEQGFRAAWIDGPDSQRIAVVVDWRNHDRLEIRGDIPTPYDRRRYDYVSAEITVSRDKGAAKIAADITRRLLPDYLPKLAESLETERQHAAYVANVAENAAGLEAVASGILRPVDHRSTETSKAYSLNLADGYGSATVMGSSVTLELNAIAPALAARILEFIASA
jgi:hypothetical protein